MADYPRTAPFLLDFLRRHPGGLPEHRLLLLLREAGIHPFTPPPATDLDLFRQHFLLFHLLYRLAEELRDNGEDLDIHCLNIRIIPHTAEEGVSRHDGLAAYYLDLAHLEAATQAEVKDMIYGVHDRLAAEDEEAGALATLGLERDACFTQIRRRFRELASRHHPDRGGDTEAFKHLNRAMRTLARVHGKGSWKGNRP